MSIEIKKIKLTKNRTIEVQLTEMLETDQGIISNEVTKKCESIAHDDLVNAMQVLTEHLKMICEMDGPVADFKVTGFTIGGTDDSEGVTLIGNKTLQSGKVLNLVAPFIGYYDENGYKDSGELSMLINVATEEVKEYLNGKCAVKQTKLEFDPEDENATITLSEEPKKRGRKRKLNEEQQPAA